MDPCQATRRNKCPFLYYPDLPIVQKKDEIIAHLKKESVLVVSASTGSGKSTQLAKFCLEAGFGLKGKIVCVQPRRIAAISLAKRIATELQEELGQSVDYVIRFDDKTTPHALIRLMTDGMLLAKMQQDPFLRDYEAVIIDEAHERSLNIDLLLGLLWRLHQKRPHLRIIIASATLDAKRFCFLWQAPLVHIETALYPIEVRYRPQENNEDLLSLTRSIIYEILQESYSGDILVFMPCEQDIHQTIALCQDLPVKQNVEFLPLYARLSQSEQHKIFVKSSSRKVIVSTNIAETSLTIDGITYVVDTGLARISQYSSITQLQSLPIVPISRASANQRKGRCGRTAPGVCYRLYAQEDFESRPEFTCPEIQRSNLSDAVLRMISLGIRDLVNFPFPDPPQKRYFHAALLALHELGAITDIAHPHLTTIGKTLAHLPIDPRLGRILLAAHEEGCLQEAIIIVAALAGQDITERPRDKRQAAEQKHAQLGHNASDFLFFLNVHKEIQAQLAQSHRAARQFCQDFFLSYRHIREWLSLIEQLRALLQESGYRISSLGDKSLAVQQHPLSFGTGYEALHRALLHGYARFVAHLVPQPVKNTEKPRRAYQNLHKKFLKVVRGSALYKTPYPWMFSGIVIHAQELIARVNAAMDAQWLVQVARPLLKYKIELPAYNVQQGEVLCQRRGYWGDVLIDPGQTVALWDFDAPLAKELFIRGALLTEQADPHLGALQFWAKNRALKQEIENIEHKLRQKFYVGDEGLYQFYDRALPSLGGWVALRRHLQEHGEADLLCTQADLLAQTAQYAQEDYPEFLAPQQQQWPIAYCFAPGETGDGYTITLHTDDLDDFDVEQAEWGIPGQFAKRIEEIVHNLAKEYRIKLHPMRSSCQTIVQNIVRKGPFYRVLQQFCQQEWHIFIPEDAWREADTKTQSYLHPIYVLQDYQGRTIAQSRVFADLKQAKLPHLQESFMAHLKAQYEQSPFQNWPNIPLAQALPVEHQGKKVGSCYPVLQAKDNCIALKLLTQKQLVAPIHTAGCRAWLLQRYRKELSGLKKSLEDRFTAPCFSYFGGARTFWGLFWQGALLRYFTPWLITEQDALSLDTPWLQEQAKLIQEDKVIALDCIQTYAHLRDTLAHYTQKHAHLKRLWQELRTLLEQAAGADTWTFILAERLNFLPTYLKSLATRAQRTIANPNKEKSKAQTLEPLQNKIDALFASLVPLTTPFPLQIKLDTLLFWWNIIQVKTFTPELVCPIKVSPDEIEKYLADILTESENYAKLKYFFMRRSYNGYYPSLPSL